MFYHEPEKEKKNNSRIFLNIAKKIFEQKFLRWRTIKLSIVGWKGVIAGRTQSATTPIKEGKQKMTIKEFLKGNRIKVGQNLRLIDLHKQIAIYYQVYEDNP